MDIKERFAKKLKEELKRKKITQKELAKRAKLSEAYVSQILKGKRTPTITVAKRIAESLNEPVSYFLENGTDVKVLLRRNRALSDDDIRAIEAFIDYIIEKKNNEDSGGTS